jgi:hypothetical protein
MLSLRSLGITSLVVFFWFIALVSTKSLWLESFVLVINQSLLSLFIFYLLIRNSQHNHSVYGPKLIFIFGLHAFLYYNISNIIPSLLPELRPQIFEMRIPGSSVLSYSLATIAAGLMLMGVVAGAHLALLIRLPFNLRAAKPYSWLPEYNLNIAACLVLLILLIISTAQFGVQSASGEITGEVLTNMTLSHQLIFHGLHGVLPIAPILAAAALVKASNSLQQRKAKLLFVLACFLTLSILLVWGQRSTAMLALALPIWLLVYARIISWQKVLLPIIGVMFFVYTSVTVVRDSNLLPLLLMTSDLNQLSISEVITALITMQSKDHNLATRALMDLSYRYAGLEAVSALIQEQNEGRISFQWGNTILCGFLQTLPVTLRPDIDLACRIKTAPAYLGIFQQGDWVTTILAEFVLDFGPFLLVLPAVLSGVILTFADRILFGLGQFPSLGGLLILRIMFFLFIITNGGSIADMTIMLFKATIGYTIIFVFLSYTIHTFRKKRNRNFIRN